MTVHCAWCDTQIAGPVRARTGTATSRESDGICRTCLSQQLAALALPATAPGALFSASATR